ncbi:MAG: rhomboid family intramembrane serine protease [Acidobacteria bacterium]|nr:MAG: rhomboid family intramembrane serine protease [Acidobacteriota bacterium]PYR44860.1 MAG: rhomboid family intramembrane serine protease [Acidobacteriota bacterium]
MIPFRDDSRRPVHVPLVTAGLIGLNAAVFVLEILSGEPFIHQWSLVPAAIVAGKGWITMVTAMFLHAGWAHILGNMVFLWTFGPQIEDVMGRGRYLVFYLLGGLAATVAQIAASPVSTIPILGASGAIAAVMGAFLITFPRDRIRTLLIFGWFITVRLIPAAALVGFWFVTQLFSELGALATVQTGGVAYVAHIGGFVMGMITARLFEDSARLAYQRWRG